MNPATEPSSARAFRSCTICEALCGIVLEGDNVATMKLRGDDDDPLSRGALCPKAFALLDVQTDADRLRTPLIRDRDGVLREASWEDAFARAATLIRRVQTAHGTDALAIYLGNPTVHSVGALTAGQLFMRQLHTRNRASATSVDQLPQMLASYVLYGNQLLLPVPDLDRTELLVLIGTNPMVSNGSLGTTPGFRERARALRERGGRLVVIDPRRTETAAVADQHLPIRPGTDALFLLAVVHTLFAQNLVRLGHLADLVDGLPALEVAVQPFTPERVASTTGIPADDIKAVATSLAAAERGVVHGRFGACTQRFGGTTAWLIQVVNLLTGHLDREGGAMFTTPAVDIPGMAARLGLGGSFDRRQSRVRQLPEFGGEIPATTLLDEMTTPGPGRVRGLLCHAGNPVLSLPQGDKLSQALAQLDAVIAIDFYLNETTRHAHVILPPTPPLERPHYDLVFSTLACRNVAKVSLPTTAKEEGTLHDWEIFTALSARLPPAGWQRRAFSWTWRQLMRLGGPLLLVRLAIFVGPYGFFARGFRRLRYRDVVRTPSGVDLGALKPTLRARLAVKQRRIRALPDLYRLDFDRVEAALTGDSASAEFPLRLIGRRDFRSHNSWLHNSVRLARGKPRCVLEMNPEDAKTRGIEDHDTIMLRSNVGEAVMPVLVTTDVPRGVVCAPHGFGHDQDDTRLSVARTQQPGVNINRVIDRSLRDALSGNAMLSDIPVDVVRWPNTTATQGGRASIDASDVTS